LLGDLLDSGEIDFVVLDVLEEFTRIFSKKRAVLNPAYNEESRAYFIDTDKPINRVL
jgi:hypothetical protein